MVRRGKNRSRPEDTVPSPCIRQCNRIDFEKEICLGCFRTMDEIGAWWNLSDADKEKILKRIAQRRGGDLAG